jgi:hypothetical protein
MNYHAEKIDYMAVLNDLEVVDPDLGGVVEEVHTCPGCGDIGTRRSVRGEGSAHFITDQRTRST